MGMVTCLRAIDDRDLDALVERPGRIARWFFGEEPPAPAKGLLARVLGRSQPPAADDWEPPSDELPETDLDKAWHGIHFLLTGDAESGDFPRGFLLDHGVTIGDVDVGYGPAHGFRSDDVKRIADALDGLGRDAFARRYDAESLAEAGIYPDIWDEGDEALEYLLEYFDELRGFVRRTADAGHGILIWLS